MLQTLLDASLWKVHILHDHSSPLITDPPLKKIF